MKNYSTKKTQAYIQNEEIPDIVGETISPIYKRGGLDHALGLLGLSQPDSLLDAPTDFDIVEIIRKGLSKTAMDKMMSHMNITSLEMSRMLHTSDRTMRRYTTQSVLNPEQSERLIELARLFAHGVDVFGSADRFRRWMSGPVFSLGGQQPIDLMDTSIGISLVNNTLGRIEHGIPG